MFKSNVPPEKSAPQNVKICRGHFVLKIYLVVRRMQNRAIDRMFVTPQQPFIQKDATMYCFCINLNIHFMATTKDTNQKLLTRSLLVAHRISVFNVTKSFGML